MFFAATEGSARCLRRDDIGKIAVGKQAIRLFPTGRTEISGLRPIAALILCGAHRADRVMISGEWRVLDGEIVEVRAEPAA